MKLSKVDLSSDLMMVMFVLFAALIAAQALQPRVEAVVESKPEPVPQRFDVEREKKIAEQVLSRQPSFQPLMELNVFAQSQQAVREADIDDVEVALLADQSVKVSVQGPMLFELGKANLKPGMKTFLNRLAVIIAATPYQVRVVGHTDDQPINTGRFPSNWELSLVRGSRVARYLIEAEGLDPTRFIVMGRGQYAPAVPNEDASKRALNRRVEIIITRDIEPSRQEVSS